MAFKAQETARYIKMGMSSISGSGKTTSALRLSYGLVKDWDKIGVVDAGENAADLSGADRMDSKNPDLRCKIGSFLIEKISKPFNLLNYVGATVNLIIEGCEVVIIDSISPLWSGDGGMVEDGSGDYKNWNGVNKYAYNPLIDFVKDIPFHLILLIRRENKIEVVVNAAGQTKVKNLGTKDDFRKNFDFELTTKIFIGPDNKCYVKDSDGDNMGKDRTGIFLDLDPFIMKESYGEQVVSWSMPEKESRTRTERVLEAVNMMLSFCNTKEDVNFLGRKMDCLKSKTDSDGNKLPIDNEMGKLILPLFSERKAQLK